MVLYIDHYDSFVNTIVDYINHLGFEVDVYKTDSLLPNFDKYTHIIIGPGPGHPNELINQYEIIKYCEKYSKPLLGICLGHQLIAQYYGSTIVKAKQILHGRNSKINNINNSILYKNLPNNFEVTRYHSLIIKNIVYPLQVTSLSMEQEIMSYKHQFKNIFGVQYHPEAYLTEYGIEIFRNFLTI